jgi:PAS domain S-box-containing protein
MNQTDCTPKIGSLRRSQKILERQIRSRTAEVEKANESLRDEITKLKRIEKELNTRLQGRTDELACANETLLAETSERAWTEESLGDSEKRYRVMADATPVLIWQSGPDKLCTYFNKGWLEFTGRTIEQELGNGWTEGLHPGDLQHGLDSYTMAFDRREPFAIEYRLRHRSGEYRWILDRGAPQFRSDGAFLGYIGGAVDTHDRKQAEEALNRSREELRALAARLQAAREEERTQLAREIHDELSGSLTALKMEVSLLPDRAAKDQNLFLEKLGSISGLIDRTLARVQSIATELRPVVLDRLGLVAAIEWQTRKFQERSGIVCETHLPGEEIPLEPDRSTAVFRIFQEAMTNVARHAEATKVVVDLRSQAGSLILTVRDNGKGIDEKSIFDQNSLGLLGMRERAFSFGGTTEVSRLPGRGTLVRVRLSTT